MLFAPKKISGKMLGMIVIGTVFSFACFFIIQVHAQSATGIGDLGTSDVSGTDLSGSADTSANTIAQDQQEEEQAATEAGPTPDDIDMTTTPENPGAFTKVDINISSNLIDLNRYNETWNVDVKIVQNGIGVRDITVETKNYGQPSNISVTITLPDSVLQKQLALEPEDMAMMW